MRAVIFANGVLGWVDPLDVAAASQVLIIAADGGANHCRALGLVPQVLIGDLDSVAPEVLVDLEQRGIEIQRHPVDKDQTDLELALEYAVRRDAEPIIIYGAAGGRWDMTVANLLLLAHGQLAQRTIRLMGNGQQTVLLTGAVTYHLHGEVGDLVSLIPLSEAVSGVTLKGFVYPLHAATLTLGSSRGVSNRLERDGATITIETGKLLCIHMGAGRPAPGDVSP